MNSSLRWLIGLIVGAAIGASAVLMIRGDADIDAVPVGEKKPLYWVAPMDPDYRRDKPGKSPMGMDLIPVYQEGIAAESPGTVKISPEVVNNLGVRTAMVERGRLGSAIDTVGHVEYDANRRADISPRVEGWVEKLHVKALGDRVQRGEPLYEIYAPMLVNAQEEYLLAKRRDNALLIDAAADRLRALQLSDREIQQLGERGRALRRVSIPAPQSGVIEHLNVREGGYVEPGMSLMTISVLEHIWVIGEVFERQMAQLALGDRVTLQFDHLPGRQWEGGVEHIHPSLNSKTRSAQVRVQLDNPEGLLRPGMFATMRIDTGVSADALLLPLEALIRTGKQNRVVLALDDGKFKSVAVDIGRISEQRAEVLDGLMLGDRVVTSAQFLIDSESSKTSDFKRMSAGNDQEALGPDSVWAEVRVERVESDRRKTTLAHPAIEAWHWPAMSMDFEVEAGVDIDRLAAGMTAHVQLTRRGDGKVRLSGVHIPAAASSHSEARPEDQPGALEPGRSLDGDETGEDHSADQHGVGEGG